MNRHPLAPVVLLLLVGCAGPAFDAPPRPNVVLILADDMGLASLHAAHDRSGLVTPHLDRLAGQGISFLDAHSGSAVCSPTRYGLLTGRYAWRTRLKRGIVGKWEPPLIAEERQTLAELLQSAGYRTHCVGKWHLGWRWPDAEGRPTTDPAAIDYSRAIGGGPLAHGFDTYLGDDVPNWPPYVWIEGDRVLAVPTERMSADPANGVSAGPMTPGWRFEDVLPTLVDRCVEVVEEAAAGDAPFFLFFSMTSPHTPINPSEAFLGTSGAGRYADFLLETDAAVGAVLAALDRGGLADDTLVIFAADNGTSPKCDFEGLAERGVDLRGEWRGHKADIWEGGHRVPFLVRWPGVVAPGRTSADPICLTDVMATVADALHLPLPGDAGEDGVSLMPALRGDRTAARAAGVVHHSSGGRFAFRDGRWKLVFCPGSGGWSAPREGVARAAGLPERQLYDVEADPGETRNLVDDRPDVVRRLTQLFEEVVAQGCDGPTWWPRLPWPERTPSGRAR